MLAKHFLKSIARNSNLIIVSSYDSRKDLLSVVPEWESKIRVLQFVSEIKDIPDSSNFEIIKEKYGLKGEKYFIITNQFWKHKNHQIVLESLLLLKQRGAIPFKIVATGKTSDTRDIQYTNKLFCYIKEHHLENDFLALGEIPYIDVLSLIIGSLAVIQPSLFEGWNTSVEECKSIGKKLILSDIAIHREQNPDNVIFFDPYSKEMLAAILNDVYHTYNDEAEYKMQQLGILASSERWGSFSENYLNIVSELISENN
ncbi:hypothetical protein AGMMS4952_26220 [Spirochaetia bacterium]|nr:hypothetical protein AGMMS4952_26220 [Spirochaetia bacterium]